MRRLLNWLFGKRADKLTAGKRHEFRYELQYHLIPSFLTGVSSGKIGAADLVETGDWDALLKRVYNKDFFFEWDRLVCDRFMFNDNYEAVLYIFPSPQQVPDAAYGIVVIDTRTRYAVYYTLEMSFGDAWVVGVTDGMKRYNIGAMENCSLEDFVKFVEKRTVV